MTLTIGSLFAGIGGLELGLEWAGLGPTLWQVEKDPKCRQVLARHWPEALRYDDVCQVGAATLAPVDLLCGGFPCQDVSAAGRRAGLSGARSGLWNEFARIVGELRPRWVVIENVRSGARNWVDAVRRDLEWLGYDSLPIPISASDVGAPHARARVFIVAATAHPHHQELASPAERKGRTARESAAARASAADPDGQGQPRPGRRAREEGGRWSCDARRCWTSEPDVARVAFGISRRMDRERQLGNSVVPQCAEVIGHVIRQLLSGDR